MLNFKKWFIENMTNTACVATYAQPLLYNKQMFLQEKPKKKSKKK